MQKIDQYTNGNYSVELYDDGTKIRTTQHDSFEAEFPESIDLKITNYCNKNCPMCHEESSKDGEHGNLNHYFFNTLRKGTELAIGGGNPLGHPCLTTFLHQMYHQGVKCNLTVHQDHFMSRVNMFEDMCSYGIISGLGISVHRPISGLRSILKRFPNAVLHTINGITDMNLFKYYADNDLKVLILGYKNWGRGSSYYNEQVESVKKELYRNIHSVLNGYKVVSFDNLAINQLNVRRVFTTDEWNTFYMGDDGQHTMYIDVVKGEYAKNSTSPNRYNIKSSIDEMFLHIKGEK